MRILLNVDSCLPDIARPARTYRLQTPSARVIEPNEALEPANFSRPSKWSGAKSDESKDKTSTDLRENSALRKLHRPSVRYRQRATESTKELGDLQLIT